MSCHIPLKAICKSVIKKSFLLLIVLFALGEAHAEVITVCPSGCDYTSISTGINSAHTMDTVEVHSGTYVENIVVKKPVILWGMDTGSGRPIVDANYNESGITIAADGVVLKGFEINHSRGSWFDLWAGINVISDDNIVTDNFVIDNENGIFVQGFNNNTIVGNQVVNNKYGIKLANSRNNKLVLITSATMAMAFSQLPVAFCS